MAIKNGDLELMEVLRNMAKVKWERYSTRRNIDPTYPPAIIDCKIMTDHRITTVVINNRYVGSTRFNPTDKEFNPRVGRLKAADRAISKMMREHTTVSTPSMPF